MNKQVALSRVMESLQEAALDHTLWPRTSALVDETCGLVGNGLVVGEGLGEHASVHFANFYFRGLRRQDLERQYFARYHPIDERVPRLRLLPDGQVVRSTDLYTDQELKTSLAYNEGQRLMRTQNGLIVRLDGPDGLRIVWSLGDPAMQVDWGSDQVTMIESLLSPIRQFVRVRQALAGAQALGSSLSGLLNNGRIGVIHLDRRGRMIEANARALAILRRADGLFDRGGHLGAWLPADNARLQRLLSRALPPLGGQGAAGTVTIGRLSGQRKLVLHANPVEDRWLDFGARRVAALLLVVEPGSQARLDRGLVAEAFGLTAAETEVAVMLSEGRTPRAIATLTGRRPGTVYNLIKLAYRKLGVSRQVDLARLLWQFSDVSGYQR
ncbi:MAG: helix-turn-helix transcriptional regulator [Candidatus Tectomicrobia bacterium]|nr:helix-turn-helix transcriptional regulator [Candidatus Tectomicrobia bacterium]